MDCSLPGSFVHGILQARILEWVAIPFSRGIFPNPGSNPGLPHCRWILYYMSHQGSPDYCVPDSRSSLLFLFLAVFIFRLEKKYWVNSWLPCDRNWLGFKKVTHTDQNRYWHQYSVLLWIKFLQHELASFCISQPCELKGMWCNHNSVQFSSVS